MSGTTCLDSLVVPGEFYTGQAKCWDEKAAKQSDWIKKKALSEDDEDTLWEKGLLGDATPQTLLDTMVFCNGLYFALRSGKEHRQLRLRPCQVELVERDGERAYLKYTEDISKNRPGGIKGRKVNPKIVYHHASA